MDSYFCNFAKIRHDFCIAINDFFLRILSQLPSRLCVILHAPSIENDEGISNVGVGVRGRKEGGDFVRKSTRLRMASRRSWNICSILSASNAVVEVGRGHLRLCEVWRNL